MLQSYELSDVENKIIRNFWGISHTLHRVSEGKGSQQRILLILRENRGMTQRELTEHLGIQPGSASEVIGKLEASGLIRRTPSRADRRTTDVRLTAEGEAAAEEAYERRKQRHQRMFACLSEEEKQALLRLLEKTNAYWEAQDWQGGAHRDKEGRGRK